METIEYNHEDFNAGNQNKLDEGLLVKFYHKSRQDAEATMAEGRPIFKEVEYVNINAPGRKDGVARPATFADKQRFPRHYAAFKQRVELVEVGTPLIEWPLISRSLAEEMAYFNVKTVEQLVAMSDSEGQKFHGIHALKEKAIDWLEKSKGDAVELRLREELDASNAQVATLTEQLEALMARVAELEEED